MSVEVNELSSLKWGSFVSWKELPCFKTNIDNL